MKQVLKGQKIGIIGAGLTGSLLANYIRKRGADVTIFEKRPDPREKGYIGGRSINLALSHRGWNALKEVSIDQRIQQIAIPMKGRMLHDVNKNLKFQAYGQADQAIYSVSRGMLNMELIQAAEDAGAQIKFSKSCKSIINNLMEFEDGQTASADIIMGADGAYSAVRNQLQFKDRFSYSQHYLDHGYKELSIPPLNDDFALEPNALHIWPRKQFMLIALPNQDKSFTCTLFLPFEGKKSFEQLQSDQAILRFFEREFTDALPLMPTLLEDFRENPTSSLVTVRCFPWHKDGAFVIGDAAHAIVPFYGQGMNACFEDCRLLNQHLDTFNGNWESMLSSYQQFRKPDADAISHLALQNFLEMRDWVADEQFLLRKKIEARLHEEFPNDWIPQYSMVTFTDIPYAEALRCGNKQLKMMEEVMRMPDIKTNWQTMDLLPIIEKWRGVRPEEVVV